MERYPCLYCDKCFRFQANSCHIKYFRYLHKTNIIVLIILSAAKQPIFDLSSTMITGYLIWICYSYLSSSVLLAVQVSWRILGVQKEVNSANNGENEVKFGSSYSRGDVEYTDGGIVEILKIFVAQGEFSSEQNHLTGLVYLQQHCTKASHQFYLPPLPLNPSCHANIP